jgi:UDP-GlcNAc:undecaprenyl-phosphate/decaprenyl-phosphate GlcNAc-1-phosphate transferase
MQLLVFAAALFVSATLTRWVRDVAVARGWNSKPSSDRHVHKHPVPRLGGVAIFVTLWCMVLLGHWIPGHFGMREYPIPSLSLKILGPASIIFVLGLVDDFVGLGATIKFAVQACAGVLLFFNGFGISQLSILSPGSQFGWLIGLPLTILWVLWITNAFNLIDGLDGLAAGSALFSTLVTCVVAMLFHNDGILFLTLVLAGAIAGFLRYNFNPASIFLGDCGSLLIGFLLSAIALAGSQKAPTVIAVAIPVVSLGLPILDVAVAVIRRFLSGRRLFDADREHIHHKLLGRGISHKRAVLMLYGVSACFGLLSLLLLNPNGTATGTVLVLVGIGVLLGVQQLRYPEFAELGRAANRTLNQRQVIVNDIRIRRAAGALSTCTSLPQFCQIMRRCLEPIGFDGFGLYLSSEVPREADFCPFNYVNGSKLQLLWTPTLGALTLYRQQPDSPLWLDLDAFAVTGFAAAVAGVVEKMQSSWFVAAPKKERVQRSAFDTAASVIAARTQSVPTSG